MKPWSETITLPQPLRDVRLKDESGPDTRPAAAEELRASYERGRREAEQAASALERVAVMLPDPVDPEPVLRDGSDDYLLALARSGDAEAIVTGDKDLLDHAGLQPPAISAREAVDRLASS